MNPTPLMTRPAVIHHRTQTTTRDEMGNPTVTTTDHPCKVELQQTNNDEITANTELARSTWDLFLPPDTADHLEADDTITIDGVDYELAGPPWPAWNPRLRRVTHLEATVRRTV